MTVTNLRIPESYDNPYRLGRSVSHDSRSRAFAVPVLATPALTDHSWPRYTPILDQSHLLAQGITLMGNPDSLSSCTGNAGIGILGSTPLYPRQNAAMRRALRSTSLAETHAIDLYAEATELDEFPDTYPPTDSGSSGLGLAKAMLNNGYITGYDHAFGLQATLSALQVGPVLLGVSWYESMFHTTPDGRMEISGAVVGGHELVIDALWMTEQVVRLPNSWGAAWGDEGCFFLSFDQLDRLLAEQGDVISLRAA